MKSKLFLILTISFGLVFAGPNSLEEVIGLMYLSENQSMKGATPILYTNTGSDYWIQEYVLTNYWSNWSRAEKATYIFAFLDIGRGEGRLVSFESMFNDAEGRASLRLLENYTNSFSLHFGNNEPRFEKFLRTFKELKRIFH